MNKFFILCFVCLLSGFFVSPASASEPKLLGSYGDWDAYMFMEGGSKVCYMASQPQKAEGNYTRRGDIFALVTHRPAENSRDVFSYVTGYTYKTASDASVQIGSKRFVLFTQDDKAWAPDEKTDRELAEAIRRGFNMVVRGVSSRGTKTTDTFSLKGSSGAYERISKECGV